MPIRYLTGGALLLAGAALLLSALWPAKDPWQVKRIPLPIPADLVSHYPPTGFERLEIQHQKTGKQLTVNIARYQDGRGAPRQALLPEPGSRQWQDWMEFGRRLRTLEPEALVIAWWDDGQRIDFLSGRAVWVRQPPIQAFAPAERPFWQLVSGGFGNPSRLTQLAKWLTESSKEASRKIARLKPDTPLYLLVSSDNLAHANEIEHLAEQKLPLEVRVFPSSENFHGLIAGVQRWAQETGGGYLPHKVPGGVAAWRIAQDPENTDEDSKPLLVRLLPFTTSLATPVSGLERVHQSSDGYLTLYRRR